MLGKILGGLGFLVALTVRCVFAMPTYRQGEAQHRRQDGA